MSYEGSQAKNNTEKAKTMSRSQHPGWTNRGARTYCCVASVLVIWYKSLSRQWWTSGSTMYCLHRSSLSWNFEVVVARLVVQSKTTVDNTQQPEKLLIQYRYRWHCCLLGAPFEGKCGVPSGQRHGEGRGSGGRDGWCGNRKRTC